MDAHCLAGAENLHHLREDHAQCIATPRLVSHGQEADLLLDVFNGVVPWLPHGSGQATVLYTGRHHEEADVMLGDEIVVLDLMGWFAQ